MTSNAKTLAEAKVIARCSDPEWLGEELFRLQTLAAKAVAVDQVLTPDTLRRLARLVWIQVAAARNPWFGAAASGQDPSMYRQWMARNQTQIDLTRALFRVVFEGADPTEDLLREALDFLST